MHKSSISTRFTIASKQPVIKPLSKYITAPFKLFCKSMEKFYNKKFSTYDSQNIIFQPYISTYHMIN